MTHVFPVGVTSNARRSLMSLAFRQWNYRTGDFKLSAEDWLVLRACTEASFRLGCT